MSTKLAEAVARLPPISRRILAIAVVPLALLGVVAAMIFAVLALVALQGEWRADARSILGRAREATKVQARLQQQTLALNASPLWGKFYTASTPGSGAIALQTDIEHLLGSAQATAQSIVPIPSVPMAQFTKIGIRLTASMRINQLESFLASAAMHPHYVRVEQLSVVAPQTQTPTENPPLAITMEVHGFELPAARVEQAGTSAAVAMNGQEP